MYCATCVLAHRPIYEFVGSGEGHSPEESEVAMLIQLGPCPV